MTVSSIPVKFSQGLRQKDVPNARVAVESGLQTSSTGSKYVSIPLVPQFNQDGEFSICWTMDQVTLNDPFSTVYGNRLAAFDFVVVQLLPVSATEFSVRMTYNGTLGTINHVINVPIQYLTQKTDFVLLCETDVSTGGVNETSLYANGRLIGSVASGTSGNVLSDGTDASIGSNAGAATTFLDGVLSHVALLDRHLTQREITAKWTNGGFFPESCHDSILAHWVLTHRYAPLTGPNRIVDVVEQYSYARDLFHVGLIATWVADLGFTQLGNAIRYDGTAGGSRSQSETIVNLSGGDVGKQIRITFNVTQLIGAGGFYVFIGQNNPAVVHQYITAVGLYTINLQYDSGGFTLSFSNVDPVTGVPSVADRTTDYTFDNVFILDGVANHGELVGYTDAEVGAIDPVTNEFFKDFYKKAKPFWGYFRQEYQVSNGLFHVTGVSLTSANKLMIYEGTFDRNGTGLLAATTIAGIRNGGAALDFTLTVSPGEILEFRINAATIVANTPSRPLDGVNFRVVMYHNFTTNDWVFAANIGGIEYTFSGNHVPGNPAFAATSWRVGRSQSGASGHLNFFREMTIASPASLTVQQALDLLRYDYSGIVPLIEVNADDIEGDIIDLQGNTVTWLANDDPPARLLGAGAWVEDHSRLPQPTLALQLDGSLTQKLELPNFTGSIPDRSAPGAGWTFIMGFALDENRDFVQFEDWLWGKRDLVTANEIIGVFGSSGSTKSLNILHQNNASGSRQDFQTPDIQSWFTNGINLVSYRLRPDNYGADPLAWTGEWYLNGALISTHQSSQQDPPDFSDVTGSFFLWGERFAARTLANASVFYSAIWQRALSPKEIIRITNNGIIRNPSVEMQDRLELYVNYNDPFDNGGTPEFRDLSPNNHQIIANGFANLAAVQAAQVNINTLR